MMPAEDRGDVAVVIPTIGRASLRVLLASLGTQRTPLAGEVVLVDDRRGATDEMLPSPPAALKERFRVLASAGRGPATARNRGWRATSATWVVFLDDDVVAPPQWSEELLRDLCGLPERIGGSQGRIEVPLPRDRRPTDWERNVAGLEQARWATADMAYRRDVLREVDGFDERFPRAYREDADLGIRVARAGYHIVRGRRRIVHPVRPTGFGVSLWVQAGNAEDPFMRALHGRDWRKAAGLARGRRPWHIATVAAASAALLARSGGRAGLARAAAWLWGGLTAELTWRRLAPGPRTRDEFARMVVTSPLLPFAAVWHWSRGVLAVPRRLAQPAPLGSADLVPSETGERVVRRSRSTSRQRDDRRIEASPAAVSPPPTWPAAVLFDRDGTLIHDVAYNADPDAVLPVEGAVEALARLRSLGIPTAVITNQSGIGRGLLTEEEVTRVNVRMEELLGPLGPWEMCPHAPDDGCRCRKPEPELVRRACRRLGVAPEDCVVIGDIGSDVEAARAAGARAVLVPTAATRSEEIEEAPVVARHLLEAVELALRPLSTATGGAA